MTRRVISPDDLDLSSPAPAPAPTVHAPAPTVHAPAPTVHEPTPHDAPLTPPWRAPVGNPARLQDAATSKRFDARTWLIAGAVCVALALTAATFAIGRASRPSDAEVKVLVDRAVQKDRLKATRPTDLPTRTQRRSPAQEPARP